MNRLKSKFTLLILFSLSIVSLGQPAVSSLMSLLAATIGYGLFFYAIADMRTKQRFFWGTGYFFLVSAIQLRWFISHPYLYIWVALFTLSLFLGLQFGLLSLLAGRKAQEKGKSLILIPALWTLFEWSRLFLLSGYTFNPAGLSLTWSTQTLQCVQFFGVFGLSFYVMLTNAAFSRALLLEKKRHYIIFTLIAIIPVITGTILLDHHEKKMAKHDAKHPPMHALIVDLEKLPEELVSDTQQLRRNPFDEAKILWEEILTCLMPYKKNDIDLIVLPEIVIPLPSDRPLFSNAFVGDLFADVDDSPFEEFAKSSKDIAQRMSNYFHSSVVMGLEGEVYDKSKGRFLSTNSAFLFNGEESFGYDKQVLVPLGEYIPFDWIQPLAEEYGLYESWLKGTGPGLFPFSKGILSPSICYEETFGNLMRQNARGATLLVNLTNDGWYPFSSLAEQHLELARPRTCENGIPLIRSCNFGVSCAIDSLGRTVMQVAPEGEISCGLATVSTYTYRTLYQRLGDTPIVALSFVLLGFGIYFSRRRAR